MHDAAYLRIYFYTYFLGYSRQLLAVYILCYVFILLIICNTPVVIGSRYIRLSINTMLMYM